MKKKILCVLITGALALSMTACGKKNDANTSNESNESNISINDDANNKENSVEENNTDINEEDITTENTEDINDDTNNNESEKDNIVEIKEGRIYYHERFSGNNYFLAKSLSSDDKTKVIEIVNALKSLPNTDYLEDVENQEFTPIQSDVNVNNVIIKEDVVEIDFNKNFTYGLGSSEENSVVESIVNSIGYNLGVNNVIITFNGENYSSGHTYMEDGEAFKVSNNTPIELKSRH